MLIITNTIVLFYWAKSVQHYPLIYFAFLGTSLILGYKFLTVSSHILLIILILEFFMLNILIMAALRSFYISSSSSFLMLFFTLAVCEARIGLGLLIQISRSNGSEQVSLI